jgi:hypothetical protein
LHAESIILKAQTKREKKFSLVSNFKENFMSFKNLKNNLKFLKTAKLFLFKLHTKEDEKF